MFVRVLEHLLGRLYFAKNERDGSADMRPFTNTKNSDSDAHTSDLMMCVFADGN
jgi:hypothetical protein